MSKKKEKLFKQFKLQLSKSQYSKQYKNYMQKQYSSIQILIKKLIKMPFCREYYLHYPLDALLKGVCKKLLINIYQFIVFGYFLSEVEWKLDHYIYGTLAQVFPNVIHVNQPTNPDRLKQISMFLYFSSYSIKQFLNDDMIMFKQQMIKVFPQFQHLQTNWTNTQQTVGQILNPRVLNKFYQDTVNIQYSSDFNICVDKVLQISPCYDIAGKGDKYKQLPNFGFMDNHVSYQVVDHFQNRNSYFSSRNNEQLADENQIKIQDDFQDFKQFDGNGNQKISVAKDMSNKKDMSSDKTRQDRIDYLNIATLKQATLLTNTFTRLLIRLVVL